MGTRVNIEPLKHGDEKTIFERWNLVSPSGQKQANEIILMPTWNHIDELNPA